ncbi:4961_t:CDS:2 [Paraglomus brasilianum]|uniref:4961_t:CDS:1 n=1 Tax=Paraglomus brasilianum TaxID=144538 RepID=A0A9N9D952_9GLOM|nr:4961_t:CDS:2 [Paraglomus brasilianum]
MAHNELFLQFENYEFDRDEAFQKGLQTVVASGKDKPQQEREAFIQRAKFFYFSKTVSKKIDYDEYVAWKLDRQNVNSLDTSPTKTEACSPQNDIDAQLTLNSSQNLETTTSDNKPPHSRSFQEVVKMIAAGEMPPVRKIPDELNKNPPKPPTMEPKPKPWKRVS